MNEQNSKKSSPLFMQWGYWLGGLCCFIGILALSFGITPFILSVRKSLIMLQIPGEQNLNLRLPGSYIALALNKDKSKETLSWIKDLEYQLVQKKGSRVVELVKFPPKMYATDKKEDQIPLFQFVIDKPGKYLLSSQYPYGMEGPKIQGLLFHTDLNYVRMELFVGLALFLILGGLGLYFIWKTNKAKTLS
ncbi:MAG: hypothetical protein HYT97_03185 [Elusimicrobia bacterium]|nr:hypothetical protein [Elusimicrobiota bacterium]